MATETYRTRLVTWQAAEPLLRLVRTAVFVQEQKIPEALEWDEDDPRVMHALATDSTGIPIGTGRLLWHGDAAQIGRMAVLAEWRGHGVGASIVRCLTEEARRCGARHAFLHAQTTAVPFYERCGFVREGDEFLEDDIPHYRMTRNPI